jgi:hypothetical protein
MKYITFVLTFLIISSNLFAGELIRCLAKEEAEFHKKKDQVSGPFYKLNQELISELIQLPDTVHVQREALSEICNSRPLIRSALYLKMLNLEKGNLYSNVKKRRSNLYALDKMAMERVIDKSYHLLINFILNVQSLAKDSKCIYKKVPELKSFMNKVRFIQEDVGIKKIFHEIKNKENFYKNIFSPKILKGC